MLLSASCGGSETMAETGIRLVDPGAASGLVADTGSNVVILDLRTPEEFNAGHIEGATMIDFYSPDFEDRLAELDRDAAYVIYCRSGNRSGQTREIMERLAFADVVDIDGGIQAWAKQGHPTVVG